MMFGTKPGHIGGLKRAVRDPALAKRGLQLLVHRTLGRALYRMKNGPAVDVMSEDWDNLILLDACRFDTFDRVNPIEGELGSAVSSASHSREFRDASFTGRTFHDTVYVTANAYCSQVDDGTFHRLLATFSSAGPETDRIPVAHSVENLRPEKLVELAVDAHRDHPDKRIIAHFMQPHAPYLGQKAEEIRESLNEEGYRFVAWNTDLYEERDEDRVIGDLLDAARDGIIDSETLVEVYEENLEYVLEYVRTLLQKLDGRTVITSDHGELLGEPTGMTIPWTFHHMPKIYNRELREVPWLIVDGDRRRITEEAPVEGPAIEEEALQEQLTALGYR